MHKVLLSPSRVYFDFLCKFWLLYSRVKVDILQKGLCHTLVCCTQSPCPCGKPLPTCTYTGDAQIQFYLSLCGVPGSWCAQFVWALLASLAWMGFDSKCKFTPPTILLRLLLCHWMRGIVSQMFQCLPSYWGFSDLGHGVSPQSHCSWPWKWGISSWPLTASALSSSVLFLYLISISENLCDFHILVTTNMLQWT